MHVVIIGGGIGGLTTAIALQQHGIHAEVFEAAAEFRPVGAGIGVPPNAMYVLSQLGVSESVRRAGMVLEGAEVWEGDDLLSRATFDAGPESHGQPMVFVHRAQLHHVLAGHLQPGTLHLGKVFRSLVQQAGGVTAHFDDGTDVTSDVLVGADGIHSLVRQSIFPDATLRYSGQSCYRGVARLSVSARLPERACEIWGGENRFGFGRISPDEVYWFAPFLAHAGASETCSERAEAVRHRYAAFPAPVSDLIARTPVQEIIRTDVHDLLPLRSWSSGRVVLSGDAAHAMTPNLGQGGAQAMEDALALARALSQCATHADAFARYERVRRARVARIVRDARNLGWLAHLKPRWARRLRNIALKSIPKVATERQLHWLHTARV